MKREIQPYIPPCEKPRIAIISDFPAEQDLQLGKPLIDYRGQEFSKMLIEAGGIRSECYITTVFKERPPKGDLYSWCAKKKEIEELCKATNDPFIHGPLAPGKYVYPEIANRSINQLREELAQVDPNIIILLGNVALWAVCGITGINKFRGTVLETTRPRGKKAIATYHPGAVIADWSKRVIVLADLMKAVRESEFSEIIRPKRKIYIAESVEDVEQFIEEMLVPSSHFMIDIETINRKFISCISFAPTPDVALVIPFIKYGPKYYKSTETDQFADSPTCGQKIEKWKAVGPNLFRTYWNSLDEEKRIWKLVQKILLLPQPKGGQNFLYDIQYLMQYGMTLKNVCMDTMILHHALHPELPKSLGFLGSIYTNEASWKEFRPRGKGTEYKREE